MELFTVDESSSSSSSNLTGEDGCSILVFSSLRSPLLAMPGLVRRRGVIVPVGGEVIVVVFFVVVELNANSSAANTSVASPASVSVTRSACDRAIPEKIKEYKQNDNAVRYEVPSLVL